MNIPKREKNWSSTKLKGSKQVIVELDLRHSHAVKTRIVDRNAHMNVIVQVAVLLKVAQQGERMFGAAEGPHRSATSISVPSIALDVRIQLGCHRVGGWA